VTELLEASRMVDTIVKTIDSFHSPLGIATRAELHIESQVVLLEPGDSWVVPKGAEHAYRILEELTAVEPTSPPAEVHGRDEP
jgi:hypothetical protein